MLKNCLFMLAFEPFIPCELTCCIALHLHLSRYSGSIDKKESGLCLVYFLVVPDLVLKDKIVVYDLARQRIGWTDYDCQYPPLTSDVLLFPLHFFRGWGFFPLNLFSTFNVSHDLCLCHRFLIC